MWHVKISQGVSWVSLGHTAIPACNPAADQLLESSTAKAGAVASDQFTQRARYIQLIQCIFTQWAGRRVWLGLLAPSIPVVHSWPEQKGPLRSQQAPLALDSPILFIHGRFVRKHGLLSIVA